MKTRRRWAPGRLVKYFTVRHSPRLTVVLAHSLGQLTKVLQPATKHASRQSNKISENIKAKWVSGQRIHWRRGFLPVNSVFPAIVPFYEVFSMPLRPLLASLILLVTSAPFVAAQT